MKNVLFLLLFSGLCGIMACQHNAGAPPGLQSAAEPAADQAAPPSPPRGAYPQREMKANALSADAGEVLQPFYSGAAGVGAIDSLKKFIRTADVRFRTPDALRATLEIENIALRHGGFITSDQLLTEIEYRRVQPVNRDSAVETTRYRRHAQLTLLVPYRQLDTTLRAIGHLAEFFDHRRVQAEDISFRLIEEQLTQLRQRLHQQQVQRVVEDPGQKRENILAAADRQLESRAAEDAAQLERLKMEDAVRFSTITLDVYEQPALVRVPVANLDVATAGPSFGFRAVGALRAGWEILEALVIGLLNLWSLFLLAGLVYFLVKKFGRGRVGFRAKKPVTGNS